MAFVKMTSYTIYVGRNSVKRFYRKFLFTQPSTEITIKGIAKDFNTVVEFEIKEQKNIAAAVIYKKI